MTDVQESEEYLQLSQGSSETIGIDLSETTVSEKSATISVKSLQPIEQLGTQRPPEGQESTREEAEFIGKEDAEELDSWYGEEGEYLSDEEPTSPRKRVLSVAEQWSEPDFITDWTDFEVGVDQEPEGVVRLDLPEQSSSEIPLGGKVRFNDTHGYTFIDRVESDERGIKKLVRKFVPRIYQKIRTYKKLIPIKVTFARLSDDTEIVEEEEDINEEMEVDEIINTVLIKKRLESGQEVVQEEEVVQEIVKDPTKKRRFVKLKLINDLGEPVEELIELNDDAKRTNDIMKLAQPFTKKAKQGKDGDKDRTHSKATLAHRRTPSIAYPEWMRAKDIKKDEVKATVIAGLKQAREEQKALKELNRYLGKKLCEHYDLKGPKDPNFNYDERNINYEEEKLKYQKRLLEFNDVVNFIFNENKVRADKISLAEIDTAKEAEDLKREKQNFYDLEENMVVGIDPVEEAKSMRSMTFKELINQQKAMDNSLAKVRLDFIRSQIALKDLQNRKAEHQSAIDNMEKVDFINYEALRVKTKDLNDKLDLKEKQVLMMKDRLTQRVQALAHVRLKSDHLTVENEKLRNETRDIIEELNALRKECLLVQVERRKLEKQLSKVTSKEGLEKYPYLLSEAGVVEGKGQEQMELLSDLVTLCADLKKEMLEKLEGHNKAVEKYHKWQDDKKQKKKLFSFEFM